MKLLMESWRKFINEEPDGDGPLGKYVWPKQRRRLHPDEEGRDEEDTTIEKILATQLAAHYQGTLLSTKHAGMIADLINKGSYPEIFRRYNEDALVYRGMLVDEMEFRKLYGAIPERGQGAAKWHKEPGEWYRNRKLKKKKTGIRMTTFSPTSRPDFKPDAFGKQGSLASSWTVDLKVARGFALKHIDNVPANMLPVVFIAKANESKNMFIDSKPFYDYQFTGPYAVEQEVIGIGDIKLHEIMIAEPKEIKK